MGTREFTTQPNDNLNVALKILTNFGLKPAMTNAQYRKGTYMFSDPLEPGTRYAMYANGYYRKYVPGSRDSGPTCYQLNRTKLVPIGSGRYCDTVRILIPGDYTTMALRIIGIAQKSRLRNSYKSTMEFNAKRAKIMRIMSEI